MKRWKKWMALGLALCLMALAACGEAAEPSAPSAPAAPSEEPSAAPVDSAEPVETSEAQDALEEYAIEGLGAFTLPEGFTVDSGVITEPLPNTYAVFEKDGYYVQANRFGTDAYEQAGVPLPADLEDYSTRSGVTSSVPEGTVFDYDEYGNFAAQFTQDDGQMCYYVLLQGTESFGSIYLTASADIFDADAVAEWLSGSVLE